mgnify:CR=1 FL=1
MTTITIPKNLIKNDDLVIIPRKKYEEFLGLEKSIERRLAEESDTDLAIKIYKKEKRQGKLKIVSSLANLDWYDYSRIVKVQEIV